MSVKAGDCELTAIIGNGRIMDNQLYLVIKSDSVNNAIDMGLYLKDNKTGEITGHIDSNSRTYDIQRGILEYYYAVDNLNYSLVVEEAYCYTLTSQKQIADNIILTPNLKVGKSK